MKNIWLALCAIATFAVPVEAKNISSQLFDAVEHGNRKKVRSLLSCGINVNTLNDEHKTALDLAVEFGRNKIARDLIKYGGRVTTVDNAIALKELYKARAFGFFVGGFFFWPLWLVSILNISKVSKVLVIFPKA